MRVEMLASASATRYMWGDSARCFPTPPAARVLVMHFGDPASFRQAGSDLPRSKGPWWREMNRYHWFVFIVAALGWLFDTMDQQLFNIAGCRPSARSSRPNWVTRRPMASSRSMAATPRPFSSSAGALGGIFFGVLGDLLGRVDPDADDLALLDVHRPERLLRRCLGFLGLPLPHRPGGGRRIRASGVSLVAEVMPDRARPFALGLLQALSAVGNITRPPSSAWCWRYLTHARPYLETAHSGWRGMFVIGTFARLCLPPHHAPAQGT